jgi:hypothetical protein
VFSTTADGASTPTERLRITSAGLVGIGTSAPGQLVEIKDGSTTTVALRLRTQSANGADGSLIDLSAIGTSGTYGTDFTISNRNTSGGAVTERFRINNQGLVGIGTASPDAVLNTEGGAVRVSGTRTAGSFLDITPSNTGSDGVIFGVSYYGSGSYGPLRFAVGGSERFRCDTSGRLLVGTSSYTGNATIVAQGHSGDSAGPAHLLLKTGNTSPVSGGDLGYLFFGDANTSGGFGAWILGQRDGGTWTSGSSMPGRLQFSTTADGASSPTERMRIDNQGRVTIGTSNTPNGIGLHLYSNSTSNNDGAFLCGNANTTADACIAAFYTATNSTATSNVLIKFGINNYASGAGQINTNGASAAAFGTFSDARLKENIEDLPSQWDNIKSLRPVEFDYVESFGGGHQIGFIAQEMQTVYPDAVGIGQDEMLTVTAWSKTEARLVRVLQEALERIEQLEAEVAALKTQ